MEKGFILCPKCGKKCHTDANFCQHCAAKLRTVCNCWIKKKPYNCGQEKCPGYRLFLIELAKERGEKK